MNEEKLNMYHFVYRDALYDIFSKGHNIKAENEGNALLLWRVKFPDAIFISLIKLDL